MKYISLLLFTIFSNVLISQEEHKSLLWEVSGNGLQKKSYIYGTMHISGKLAFHLGEEFFTSIKSVDAIALESNPILWLDEIVDSEYANDYLGYYSIGRQNYNGFYQKSFKLKVLDNLKLSNSISTDHYLTNWLLYRSNKSKSDFEEETFLDMFIYQAGGKLGKPVLSLEDFRETSAFNKMSKVPDLESKETPEWLSELLDQKPYYELVVEAYRNKDLDMLDSIQSAKTSDNYLKYMLYERNEIMATNIDSIIKSGTSLFIGIGAAHLPKEKGVINLLKLKGYTVKPMSTTVNNKAKKEKEALIALKKNMPVKNKFKSDLFSLMIPNKIYETPALSYQRQFFSPELTNGSFYSVKQISTYAYYNGFTELNYLSKVDSLLFENIPGKIISKKEITKNGFKGFDIVNKTKSGNYQRYQIFQTPLQIIIFKMGGNSDYVNKNGTDFFNNITLKEIKTGWEKIQSIKTDFEINAPLYYHIKNNTKITSLYGQTEIEAFDIADSNYYYLKKVSLNDTKFIEEDDFELNRIVDKFCEELGIDSVKKEVINNSEYPAIKAFARTKDSLSFLSIKVVIKGASYYLMTNVSPIFKATNPFFDSFKITTPSYTFDYRERIDSTMYFKVNSNHLLPNDYAQVITKAYKRKRNKNETEDKQFEHKKQSRSFYSENFERIDVNYVKFHRYKNYATIDSLYASKIRGIKKENGLLVKDKVKFKKNGMDIMDVNFIDTNSVRMIKTRFVLNNGTFYTLKTLIDTVSKPSKFVNEFYNSFAPMDTVIGVSPLINKSEMFFTAIYGTDSLEKERALKSVKRYVVFKDEDVPEMINTISNYSFLPKDVEAKEQLIKDLGVRDDSRIVPFLNNLYDDVEDTAMYQIAILKSLVRQKTKESFANFLQLLNSDIPLGSREKDISFLIKKFEDSLSLAAMVYPEILNYTFVSDYKQPIYGLLAKLVDEDKIKPSKYAKYYKQILREAKIELKSQISYEQSERAKRNKSKYRYTSYKNIGNEELLNYTTLLIPFYKKKDVKEYFDKVNRVEDYQFKTDVNCKLIQKNISVAESEWVNLTNDEINYAYLYKALDDIDKVSYFPKNDSVQLKIAKSLLYTKGFDFDNDSLEFLVKKNVKVLKKDNYAYFFKTKKQKAEKWKLDYIVLTKGENKITLNKKITKKGIYIKKDKKIEDLIDDQIKEIKIWGHKRAEED
ncbi:MAG: TraB/GumN family protein [Vicingaceae bacterium]